MKHTRIFTFCALAALLAGLALTACAQAPKPELQEGVARDAVLAYSEPMVDNLLSGLNAADYAVFSRDFTDAMKKAIPEKSLAALVASTTGKIGPYVSREVDKVEKIGDFYRVTYKAKFEKDDAVTMLITFSAADLHQVAGLFFTSDKLK
jgi:hypothetical protein